MIKSHIVAYSLNRVIGKDNKLAWGEIKEDNKRFRSLSRGHYNLVGRKTYESIGTALPDRTMIVVTSKSDYKAEGSVAVDSVEKGIDYAQRRGEAELMIIGGQEIYEQTLPLTDKIYATEIQIEVDGDTFYPKINEADWQETAREERFDLNPPLIFRTLKRR